MKVSALMTKNVHSCSSFDTLDQVARVMWESDIGALPVVDERGRTIGMITDRDVAMAAYTQGKPLAEIPVWIAASNKLVAARPEDSIDLVHDRMRAEKIHRVPVVTEDGTLLGMLSLNDLARRHPGAHETDGMSAESITRTLAAITEPRVKPIEGAVYRIRASTKGWDIFDRNGERVAKGLKTQAHAIIHAKELAVRDGSAEIVVYDSDGRLVSERFYRTDEHSAMTSDPTALLAH